MDKQEFLKQRFNLNKMPDLKYKQYFTFDELISLLKDYEKQLMLGDVVGGSEQLTCPRCKSTNILNPDKDNDAQCIECAFVWVG